MARGRTRSASADRAVLGKSQRAQSIASAVQFLLREGSISVVWWARLPTKMVTVETGRDHAPSRNAPRIATPEAPTPVLQVGKFNNGAAHSECWWARRSKPAAPRGTTQDLWRCRRHRLWAAHPSSLQGFVGR